MRSLINYIAVDEKRKKEIMEISCLRGACGWSRWDEEINENVYENLA